MAESHTNSQPSPAPQGADLVSLEEALKAPRETGPGASNHDTILNAASLFEAQLEQMTAWKHQLAQQMELLRRDGIKLLERQKALAIEKKRAGEERESLTAERNRLQTLQQELEAEGKRIAERTAKIEKAHADLQLLHAEKERWENTVAGARQETEALGTRREQIVSELSAAEVRLLEIQKAEARRDELKKEIAQAEGSLAQIAQERQTLEASRHTLEIQQSEFKAKEKALGDREAHCLAEDVRLKEGLEQLEAQRRQLAEAQRQAGHDREQLDARSQELGGRAQELARQSEDLSSREQALKNARHTLEESQAALARKQEEVAGQERALAERMEKGETELKQRLAEAEDLKKQVENERAQVEAHRVDLQKNLDALEDELSDQLEMLAKHSKRLNERKAQLDEAERNMEKALKERIAKATERMEGDLARARETYEKKTQELEEQAASAEKLLHQVRESEQHLKHEVEQLQAQLQTVQNELDTSGGELSATREQNSKLAQELAAKLEEARAETAFWKQSLEDARSASANGNEALAQARKSADEARQELATVQTQIKALKEAREQLEFQVELQKEDGQKALENAQQDLAKQLASRDQEITALKEKLEAAKAAPPTQGSGGGDSKKSKELAKQVDMLEQQRNELAKQLFTVQDQLKRHEQEWMLTKNVLEGKVLELEEKNETLVSEKAALQKKGAATTPGQAPRTLHRERLLRQAKALRNFRLQMRDSKATLEGSRGELAQQREQLRARKENLEQVKRLLEKQEMVMARKLADHNAIKTVAAVGIFVIMILGSTFFGVYRFVKPVYRSEAIVQLAAPRDLQGGPLEEWLKGQATFVKTNEVTFGAWKILRSSEEHYSMHDVRDEWMASLARHLDVQMDAGSQKLFIRYSGPDAEGVSQVCNALATAYTTPGQRESTEQTQSIGLGSAVVAKGTIPMFPTEDSRLMISLCVVAVVLFVSLLLVMLFRHFVARQLKEIDQMADTEDLEQLGGDMGEAQPA